MRAPRHLRTGSTDSFSPSEALLVAQTLLVVVAVSWAGGGMPGWTQGPLLGLVALSILLWPMRRKEGAATRPLALLPAALWLGYVALALLNPSHEPAPDGTWHERMNWLRWLPTTVDRSHTLSGAGLWLAALVQGGALVGLAPSARATRFIWRGVAINGFVLAAVGAAFHFSGATRLLGEFDVPEPTYFFATFYYKNHWAAFGALGGIAGLTLALRDWRAALAGVENARGRVMFFGGTALLTLCTLPLPGSRAGFLLAAVTITIAATHAARLLARERGPRGRRWGALLLAGLLLLAMGFVARFYLERGANDLARTREQIARHAAGGLLDLRVELTRDTWRMAQARPIFGWGVGCYEVVFPVFQGDYLRDAGGRSTVRAEYAHNDWLQILAECGAVGATILFGAAGVLFGLGWRDAGSTGRLALGGLALLALYAWIDFPFHNPAVLLTWTVLLATSVGTRMAQADS